MQGYWQLTLAQLKLFARNKTIIFWTTLFPLFLMVMLGLFLGGGASSQLQMGWVDEDKSQASMALQNAFIEVEAVELVELNTLTEGIQSIEEGDLSFTIVIPSGYAESLTLEEKNSTITLYYDEVNQAVAELGFAMVDQIIDKVNKELVQFEETVTTSRQGVQALDLNYLDFLVPGIAALMILSSNMNGVAAQIAAWRERGILRRLKSTGLPASTFIAAQITARMALNVTQSILVLLVGIFLLGAKMNGSWLLLLFYILLGILVFMSIGFIIASLAKTPEHAAPVAGFLSFPMFFLGGIFFPITNMPDFIQPLIYAIPISHLTDVLRQVMNVGAGLTQLWLPTTVLIAWFVLSFGLAARIFRWE